MTILRKGDEDDEAISFQDSYGETFESYNAEPISQTAVESIATTIVQLITLSVTTSAIEKAEPVYLARESAGVPPVTKSRAKLLTLSSPIFSRKTGRHHKEGSAEGICRII